MHYLQINLKISKANRPGAAAVYAKYKQPLLTQINGAYSKELLIREDDVQVLHGSSYMLGAEIVVDGGRAEL